MDLQYLLRHRRRTMYLRGNLTKMFSRTSFGRWLRVLCSIHAELEPNPEKKYHTSHQTQKLTQSKVNCQCASITISCNTLLTVQGVQQNRKTHNTEWHRSQQKVTEIAFKKCASNQLSPRKKYITIIHTCQVFLLQDSL